MATRYTTVYADCTSCCGGCYSSLEVTFTGINTGICTNCYSPGSGTYGRFVSLVADGTYTVNHYQTIGDLCLYEYETSSASGGTQNVYPSAGCGGSPTLYTLDYIRVFVLLDISSADPVSNVSYLTQHIGAGVGGSGFSLIGGGGGPYAFGDSIPSVHTACGPTGSTFVASINATAVVTLP